MRISLQNVKCDSHFKWEVRWESHFNMLIVVLTSSERAYENLTSKCEVRFSFQVRWHMRISLQNYNSGSYFKWEGIWESHFKFDVGFSFQVRGYMRISLQNLLWGYHFKWEVIWESHFKIWIVVLTSSERAYENITSKWEVRFSFQVRGHMRISLQHVNSGSHFKSESLWISHFKCEVKFPFQVRGHIRITLQNFNCGSHFKWESIWKSHFKMWRDILISSETLYENLTSKSELRFSFQMRGHMRISLQISNVVVHTSSGRPYDNLTSKFEVIFSFQVRGHMRISLQHFDTGSHFKWESIWKSHFKM